MQVKVKAVVTEIFPGIKTKTYDDGSKGEYESGRGKITEGPLEGEVFLINRTLKNKAGKEKSGMVLEENVILNVSRMGDTFWCEVEKLGSANEELAALFITEEQEVGA